MTVAIAKKKFPIAEISGVIKQSHKASSHMQKLTSVAEIFWVVYFFLLFF